MKNDNLSNAQKTKLLFIVLSALVVAFTLSGYMLTSLEGGKVSLALFESFYVYVGAIVIAIYMIIAKRNANIMIVFAILTYPWTYYLIRQMIVNITDVTIIISPYFYIYLSSSVLLIISLFFNDKKKEDAVKEKIEEFKVDTPDNIDSSNFIFGNFVLGIKGIPFNTEALLVNNVVDKSMDLIYKLNDKDKTIKIPNKDIKNVSFEAKLAMQELGKKDVSYETKSMLLSAVLFGGHPMLQVAGMGAFNSIFDELANDYNRVNVSSYFEISIETKLKGEETKLVLNTSTNPQNFIDKYQKNSNK